MQYLFWLSIAVVIYTYAGYPLLAILLGRLRGRVVAKGAFQPPVTIIIAAYNEEEAIRATIANKLRLEYDAPVQIIVVSDASTDATDAIAREFEAAGVLLLRQDRRRGKTAALNLATEHARGEVLVVADANSIYAPDALRMLMRNFTDPAVGYVTGRMVYGTRAGSTIGMGCRAYMRYEDLLRRSETALGSIVGVTGGIDAVRRSLFVRMNEDQLEDFVLPLHIVRQGHRVVYEPEAILEEQALTTSQAEYRMRVRVALRAWWALADMRGLLDVRRHGVFSLQLFSHKVLRYAAFVAVPPLFVAAVASWESGLVYQASVGLGSVFFLFAGAGYVVGQAGYSTPLISLPYYFLLINAAAGEALVKFLLGRKQCLWTPRLG